eukprot:scaffold36587_cov17-Tisochrysis_lutea.AAC.1
MLNQAPARSSWIESMLWREDREHSLGQKVSRPACPPRWFSGSAALRRFVCGNSMLPKFTPSLGEQVAAARGTAFLQKYWSCGNKTENIGLDYTGEAGQLAVMLFLKGLTSRVPVRTNARQAHTRRAFVLVRQLVLKPSPLEKSKSTGACNGPQGKLQIQLPFEQESVAHMLQTVHVKGQLDVCAQNSKCYRAH